MLSAPTLPLLSKENKLQQKQPTGPLRRLNQCSSPTSLFVYDPEREPTPTPNLCQLQNTRAWCCQWGKINVNYSSLNSSELAVKGTMAKRCCLEHLINKIQNCFLQLCAIIGYFTPSQADSHCQSIASVQVPSSTSSLAQR